MRSQKDPGRVLFLVAVRTYSAIQNLALCPIPPSHKRETGVSTDIKSVAILTCLRKFPKRKFAKSGLPGFIGNLNESPTSQEEEHLTSRLLKSGGRDLIIVHSVSSVGKIA